MSRNYTFAPDEYYHIYARGFEKSAVYRSKADHNRFLHSLFLFNSEKPQVLRDVKATISRGLTSGKVEDAVYLTDRGDSIVDIGAYCLMPNHFHLLVREKREKGISKFMQKLMTSYTMYFNNKYERTGAIFGSSYKARHVTDDVHLKYLFAYIHLNPREIIGTRDLLDYPYSSYLDYVETGRPQIVTLNKMVFPDYFQGAMREEVEEWLLFNSPEV